MSGPPSSMIIPRVQMPKQTGNSNTGSQVAAAVLSAKRISAAETPQIDELIAKIKDHDDQVRGPAWQSAGPVGAAGVKALADVMTEADLEVARAAKRAIW